MRRITLSNVRFTATAAPLACTAFRHLSSFSGSADDFTKKMAAGSTIVDFYTEWCGPCKAVAPTFEKLSKEYEGKVNFLKVNVEEHEEVGAMHDIRSIPTFVGFRDGKMIGRIEGADITQVQNLLKTLSE